MDEDLNIKVEDAIKLVRKVEMYQWKQVEGTDSKGKTAAHYELCWSENLIDSSRFLNQDHLNPPMIPFGGSARFIADRVTLGQF